MFFRNQSSFVADTWSPLAGRWAAILVAALSLILFSLTLPHSIQVGDSTELVAKAFRLNVAHPPGYPLFIWMGHAILVWSPPSSLYLYAAIWSATLMALCLALLARHSLLGCAIALMLMSSKIVWKMAVIPDVFSLHALLIAGFLYASFHFSSSSWRPWATTIIFALSLTHHPSAVFLFPIWIWTLRSLRFRRVLGHVALCGTIVGMGYVSLFYLHPDNRFSWGNLTSVFDLWKHALRYDYGITQLSPQETPTNALNLYLQFYRGLFLDAWPVILLSLLPLCSPIQRKCFAYLGPWALFFLYMGLFVPLMNVDATGIGQSIVERFWIMPTIFLAFSALHASTIIRNRWALILLLSVTILQTSINIIRHLPENNYSNDNTVAEYASTLLQGAPAHSIIVANTDTKFFALRYLQSVEQKRPDVFVMFPSQLFIQGERSKLEAVFPQLQFPSSDQLQIRRRMNFLSDFILPNLLQTPIMFTQHASFDNVHVTYYPLGRVLSPGHGVSFAPNSGTRPRASPWVARLSSDYDERRALFSEYAYYFLAQGISTHSPAFFQEAIERVPYCLPAWENQCFLNSSPTCREHIQELQKRTFQYYR